jgi:hypothetical protein
LEPSGTSHHIILFEKLSKEHAALLLQKYLFAYRITDTGQNDLSPFTEEAVNRIGELSEYNAAKILKNAFLLLEKAGSTDTQQCIDEQFVENSKGEMADDLARVMPDINQADSVDLRKKARDGE